MLRSLFLLKHCVSFQRYRVFLLQCFFLVVAVLFIPIHLEVSSLQEMEKSKLTRRKNEENSIQKYYVLNKALHIKLKSVIFIWFIVYNSVDVSRGYTYTVPQYTEWTNERKKTKYKRKKIQFRQKFTLSPNYVSHRQNDVIRLLSYLTETSHLVGCSSNLIGIPFINHMVEWDKFLLIQIEWWTICCFYS